MFSVDVNAADVEAQLGELAKRAPAAIKNATNRTLTWAKKRLTQYIKTHYTVQASEIKKALTVKRTGKDGPGGAVKVKGSPLDLIKYQHRVGSNGVSVWVKRDHTAHPFNEPKTFIASVKAGKTGTHTGVFQRSRSEVMKKYSGRKFNQHNAKIKKLIGPSVPGMVYGESGAFEKLHGEIGAKLQEFVAEQIAKQIEKYNK